MGIGVQIARNALEVIDSTAGFHCPADHLPLHQIVGHDLPVAVVRSAVDIAGLAGIVGADRSGDHLALIVPGIEADILSQSPELHKVALGAGGKTVPFSGDLHDAYKVIEGFFPDYPHFHACLFRLADIPAHPLREVCQKGSFVPTLQIEPVIEPGLNPFKAIRTIAVPEAQLLHLGDEFTVCHGNIRVHLELMGMDLFCQLIHSRLEVGNGLPVMGVTDGAPGRIEQRGMQHRDLLDQHSHRTLDLSVCVPGYHCGIVPVLLHQPPPGGLGKLSPGVMGYKFFQFFIALRRQDLHCRSLLSH